jgi:hypothetical protein
MSTGFSNSEPLLALSSLFERLDRPKMRFLPLETFGRAQFTR